MSDHTIMLVIMIAGLVTPVVVLIGGVKLFYILGEYRPHAHIEHGDPSPLTVGGIVYPRSMNGSK